MFVEQHQNFLFGGVSLRKVCQQPVGQVHLWSPVTHLDFWPLLHPVFSEEDGSVPCYLSLLEKLKNSSLREEVLAGSAGSWARMCKTEEDFSFAILLKIKAIICGMDKLLPDNTNNLLVDILNSAARHPTSSYSVYHGITPSLSSNLGGLCYGSDWAHSWSCISIHKSLFVWIFLILCLKKSVLPT